MLGSPKCTGCQNWKAFCRSFSILQMGKWRLTERDYVMSHNLSKKSKDSNLPFLGQELISLLFLLPSSADFLRFSCLSGLELKIPCVCYDSCLQTA